MGEVVSFEQFRGGKLTPSMSAFAKPAEVSESKEKVLTLATAPAAQIVTKTNGDEHFNYALLMKRAMWALMRDVLTEAAMRGLPKMSQIYLTIDMTNPGVKVSDQIRARFEKEITIVLDSWWENLIVNEKGFYVTLNFSDIRERFEVPFDAIVMFQDAPMQFGLRLISAKDEPTPPPLIA